MDRDSNLGKLFNLSGFSFLIGTTARTVVLLPRPPSGSIRGQARKGVSIRVMSPLGTEDTGTCESFQTCTRSFHFNVLKPEEKYVHDNSNECIIMNPVQTTFAFMPTQS